MLILPQRPKFQPRYPAPAHPAWREQGLVAAFVFDSNGFILDRLSGARYTVTGAATITDRPGKVLRFDGSGDYVNTGVQSLGGVNLFASASNAWSVVISGRLENSSITGTFVGKAGVTTTNRTFQIYRDASIAAADPGVYIRGTGNLLDWDWNTSDWHQYSVTWDGSSAMAYGDYEKSSALIVGSASQEAENIVFGARSSGTGAPLTGRLAYAYFFDRAISQQAHRNLYENPWQIFEAPRRRLWVAPIGSAVDLAISASVQTNTASGISISHGRVLVISASIQGNYNSAPSVTQTHPLTSGLTSQINAVDAVPITTLHDLAIRSLIQASSASADRATTSQTLALSNAIQNNRVSTGAASHGVFIESALVGGIAATIRIKKPGIPAGTPEWLRTLLEILVGRRGNKITPIAFQQLTFSATPTGAECEALYEYMNKIRTTVNDVITRLDS